MILPINGAIVLLTGILLLGPNLHAQNNVTFWKNTGESVNHRDSADYIRVIVPPGGDRELPHLVEYFPNEQVRKVGVILDVENGNKFHGPVVEYYENGQKRAEERYADGERVGEARYYYRNGQLRKSMRYGKRPSAPANGSDEVVTDTLVNYFDSLGTALVMDGTGFVREPQGEDYEEGHYRGGLREGEWTGTFFKQQYRFTEQYQAGMVVSGVSQDTAGNTFPYAHLRTPPEYPGGIRSLMRFIAQNYRYPRSAVMAGVSGMVLLGFIVERDGSLTDISVKRDLGHGTGAAGIQVLQRARHWKPGYQRGVPVRVSYTLPIRLHRQ